MNLCPRPANTVTALILPQAMAHSLNVGSEKADTKYMIKAQQQQSKLTRQAGYWDKLTTMQPATGQGYDLCDREVYIHHTDG